MKQPTNSAPQTHHRTLQHPDFAVQYLPLSISLVASAFPMFVCFMAAMQLMYGISSLPIPNLQPTHCKNFYLSSYAGFAVRCTIRQGTRMRYCFIPPEARVIDGAAKDGFR
jgi:hypothetical protein